MANVEKYQNAFREAFGMDEAEDVTGLQYNTIPQWDSVGHMGLMACMEEAFDIMLETDDIIDFSSYERGIEILKKYDVSMD